MNLLIVVSEMAVGKRDEEFGVQAVKYVQGAGLGCLCAMDHLGLGLQTKDKVLDVQDYLCVLKGYLL